MMMMMSNIMKWWCCCWIFDSKQKRPGLHTSERTIVPRTVIFSEAGHSALIILKSGISSDIIISVKISAACWKLHFNRHCQKCCTFLEPISNSAANWDILTYFWNLNILLCWDSVQPISNCKYFLTQLSPLIGICLHDVHCTQSVSIQPNSVAHGAFTGIVIMYKFRLVWSWNFNPTAARYSPFQFLADTEVFKTFWVGCIVYLYIFKNQIISL